MRKMKLVHSFIALLLMISLGGCRQAIWNGKDMIDVKEAVAEFEVGDVMIGSNALLAMSDSLLLIRDAMATDKLVSVFSLPSGKFMGSFVEYGAGPYEVGSAGGLNIYRDKKDGKLKSIIFDYAQNVVLMFDMDSIYVENYKPHRISGYKNGVVPSHYIHVNDTLGFARKINLSPNGTGFSQSLGKFNLSTGELTDFAPGEAVAGNESMFDVSMKFNRVVEVGTHIDAIKIYDFAGNLLHLIKGPDYKEKADRRKSYFTSVVFADSLIVAAYAEGGRNLGTKLVVADIQGNYIATLETGRYLRDMKYNEPSGRLYLSFYRDDWQFGTLDLKKALKETIIEPKQPASVKKPNSTGIINSRPPVNFLNVAQKGAFGDENDSIPGKMFGDIELLPQVDSSYLVFRTLSLGVNRYKNSPDTIRIDSVKLKPDFLKLELPIKEFTGVAVMDVELGFPQNVPLGPFDGRVEIYVAGYSEPSVLKIKGTLSRMDKF